MFSLRLTIPLAFVVGFAATFYRGLVSGPLAGYFSADEGCIENWWHNLLYINIYVDKTERVSCLEHTWYLAADMTLFAASPIVVLPLYYWRKWGLRVWAASFVGCLLVPISLVIKYNLSPLGIM